MQSLLPSSQLWTDGTVTLVTEVTWLAGKVGTEGGASIWGLAGGSFNIQNSLLALPPLSALKHIILSVLKIIPMHITFRKYASSVHIQR